MNVNSFCSQKTKDNRRRRLNRLEFENDSEFEFRADEIGMSVRKTVGGALFQNVWGGGVSLLFVYRALPFTG